MEDNLTGIERELALQYLIDGNVPVTVTLFEKNHDEDEVHHVESAVLPVIVNSKEMTFLKEGIIILKNPTKEISAFIEKNVRIEFYFNNVGLYFPTVIKKLKTELAFVIPEVIYRVKNEAVKNQYDFSASIYYSCSNKSTVNFDCVPESGSELFTHPVWKSIPLENQKVAKTYLEQFVEEARQSKFAGTGVQLIPICKYLSENKTQLEELKGIVKPLSILYVDHERLVLASDGENFPLVQGAEYALKLCFSLKEGPIVTRDIFATCVTLTVYRSAHSTRTCVDCFYTSLQEEDRRFLYEKATKKLFV